MRKGGGRQERESDKCVRDEKEEEKEEEEEEAEVKEGWKKGMCFTFCGACLEGAGTCVSGCFARTTGKKREIRKHRENG